MHILGLNEFAQLGHFNLHSLLPGGLLQTGEKFEVRIMHCESMPGQGFRVILCHVQCGSFTTMCSVQCLV